ncbi:MAG: cytochrome c oxidase subunit II [Terricaulis sp.]
MKRGALFTAAAGAAAIFGAGSAWAAEGAPTPGGVHFQEPATAVMRDIVSFHDNWLMPIIVGVSVFVLALLLWIIVRFNRRANPTPRKFTHNLLIEVIWTIAPVIILVVIASQSFPLIIKQETIPTSEYTLKVTGNSWFWAYEYQDLGVSITSSILPDDEVVARNAGNPEVPARRLLSTTEPLVVPVGANVHVLVTSNDVIHAWAVPSFGVKEDAIMGRVNETWFNVETAGVYYGQCSELCGKDHAFMPIEVRAVSRAEFAQWVVAQGGTMPGAPAAGAGEAPEAAAVGPTR